MVTTASTILVTFNGRLTKVFGTDKQRISTKTPITIRHLLDLLCDSADRRERIFDEHGNLRNDITILKNGRNIMFLDGLESKLDVGDTIALFPPVCGG